jgi:hypothetical protein
LLRLFRTVEHSFDKWNIRFCRLLPLRPPPVSPSTAPVFEKELIGMFRFGRWNSAVVSFIAAAVAVACGSGGNPAEPPTTPVAAATATPVPTAAPSAFAVACGSPLPNTSELYGFGIKVQLEPSVRRKILNANPYVKNASYCASVGFGGQFCETRIETEPSRVACDHYMTGLSDAGGPGPNWYQEIDGQRKRCGGGTVPGDAPDCRLKPENQYLLDVFGPGKFVACGGAGSNGTCGVCVLDPATYDTPASAIGTRRPGLCGV